MNGHPDHLDQTDEDILTYDVYDETLEAAAGTTRWVTGLDNSFCWTAHSCGHC
jgi:hypothetical protein